MTYKIVYIDEQEEDGDNLKDFVEQKDIQNEFIVKHLYPAPSIDEMIAQIKEHSPDAIVSDFILNEHIASLSYAVPYNGMELITSFLQIREKFPCFVITAFANDAANSSEDVNIVYIKGILNGKDNADLDFLARIKIQIDHYRTRVACAENKLQELIKLKYQSELSAPQEKELIDLDSFLESSVDGRHPLPPDLKTFSNTKKLSTLLSNVDSLLAEIRDGK